LDIIKTENLNKKDDTQAVRYYEGESGMKQIQWNATYKSEGIVRVFTGLITREILGDKFYDIQLLKASKKSNPIRILVDNSYFQKFRSNYDSPHSYYAPLSEMADHIDKRIIKNEKFQMKGKFMIYNNVIVSITYSDNHLIGSEIISSSLADSFKSIFDLLWDTTTEQDRIDQIFEQTK
jgi:hypothetical protein